MVKVLKNRPNKALLSKGFTLIELMIAIAIVGILAALAVPAFANYLARARVSEAINYAQGCKTGVVEFAVTSGRLPDTNDEANCPTVQTDNIQNVTVLNGVVSVTFRAGAASAMPQILRNRTLTLQPLRANNTLAVDGQRIETWRCGIANATNNQSGESVYDFMPAICRQLPL